MDKHADIGILEEFRLECWDRLPNKLPFIVLLLAWIGFFQFLGNSTLGYVRTPSLFGNMYDDYTATASGKALENQDSFALVVPFVVAGLLWFKRQQLLALELRPWWPALVLLAAGVLIHLLGYLIQQPRISVVGFFTGVYALIGLIWGYALLRGIFFPFFLFAFCVPIGSLSDPITFGLRLLVSQLVGFISHYILAIDVTVQGNMLIDPTNRYQYEIAAACSGIRSLVATLAVAVVIAFVSLRSPWKRLILIASAFPLAVLGNMVRMLTIVICAEIWGQEAGNYVHEGGPMGILSLLPYIPAFIGLLFLQRYLERAPHPAELPHLEPLELKKT